MLAVKSRNSSDKHKDIQPADLAQPNNFASHLPQTADPLSYAHFQGGETINI